MKILKTTLLIAGLIIIVVQGNAQSANTALSNLVAPTAINADLLPATDSAISLGAAAKSWKDIYFKGAIYNGSNKFISTLRNNIFIGAGTGNSAGPISNYNTATGYQALYLNVSGRYNTANGYQALYKKGGSYNTGIGANALYFCNASYNTAVGYQGLYANTTGAYNSALGYIALQSNTTGTGNTGVGAKALYSNTTGSYNTATGGQALYANTIGTGNVANGYNALASNTTGNKNTAIGHQALYANAGPDSFSSSRNTACGYQTLFSNTTGNNNTALGYQALYSITGAHFNNTATGSSALYSNTQGSNNTANGVDALSSNISGDYNTGIGTSALIGNSSGLANTAVGNSALFWNHTGSYNTAVGNNAGIPPFGDFSNTTAIGSGSIATASNQVRLGDNAVTSIGGYANWSNISDGRFKKNIKQDVKGLDFINKLQPVTYTLDITGINNFRSKDIPSAENKDGQKFQQSKEYENAKVIKEKIIYSGFIAQDVEKAAKDVKYDFSGVDAPKNEKDLYGLRYAEFVVPLVKAVQELSAENEELKTRLENLERAILNNNNSSSNSIGNNTLQYSGYLKQNIPNPSNNTTRIGYVAPSNGKLIITDMKGSTLKIFSVSKGEGQVTINTRELAAGNYNYSLYINGKKVDSKQMVIIN